MLVIKLKIFLENLHSICKRVSISVVSVKPVSEGCPDIRDRFPELRASESRRHLGSRCHVRQDLTRLQLFLQHMILVQNYT